jgi:hypothetical protein
MCPPPCQGLLSRAILFVNSLKITVLQRIVSITEDTDNKRHMIHLFVFFITNYFEFISM